MIIVGGGYIANEFAGIFNEFGSEVTIVNRSDQLLRGYDESLRDRLMQISVMKGIQFRFHAQITAISKNEDGSLHVALDGCQDMDVDCVMYATGRVPNTAGLGLDAAGSKPMRRARSRSISIRRPAWRISTRSVTLPTGSS